MGLNRRMYQVFESLPKEGVTQGKLLSVLMGFIMIALIGFGWLIYSAQVSIGLLQGEISYWQNKINQPPLQPLQSAIPKLNALPEIIEKCCQEFTEEKVLVRAFNVERFGYSETAVGIDFALLRLQLQGDRLAVKTALDRIEKKDGLAIHVQELVMDEAESKVLLRIYLLAE